MEQVPFLIFDCEQWPNEACEYVYNKVLERCSRFSNHCTMVYPPLSEQRPVYYVQRHNHGWLARNSRNAHAGKPERVENSARGPCGEFCVFATAEAVVECTLHFASLCRYAFLFNLTCHIKNPGRLLLCLLRGHRCLDNATWCKLQPLKKFLLHFMCLFCFGLACWCCRVTHRFAEWNDAW